MHQLSSGLLSPVYLFPDYLGNNDDDEYDPGEQQQIYPVTQGRCLEDM